MAICPFAVQRLLPENRDQGKITPRAVILHTAVDGSLPNSSIYGYFARADVGDESHFYVMDNGTIEQYMNTEVRADANVSANGFAVSIETEDDGNPAQNPWKAAQLHSIVQLVLWLCETHNIPRRLIPSSTGAGIGYHSMWGINTATHKPNPWTNAVGKTCPGPPRITQFNNVIMPQIARGGPVPTPVEDELSELSNAIIADMAEGKTGRNFPGSQFLYEDKRRDAVDQELSALADTVTDVQQKVETALSGINAILQKLGTPV